MSKFTVKYRDEGEEKNSFSFRGKINVAVCYVELLFGFRKIVERTREIY